MQRFNWSAATTLKLKIVPRPGQFAVLAGVFTVGILGSTVPIEGNAALMETVVATGNTNTVIGLERAVILESAAATGTAGDVGVA